MSEDLAAGWWQAATLDDVPDGEMLEVTYHEGQDDELSIALANTEGTIYAFNNICPHMDFPLAIGMIDGCVLTCIGHAWQFDLKTGKNQSAFLKKGLLRYLSRVEDNVIYIKPDEVLQNPT